MRQSYDSLKRRPLSIDKNVLLKMHHIDINQSKANFHPRDIVLSFKKQNGLKPLPIAFFLFNIDLFFTAPLDS